MEKELVILALQGAGTLALAFIALYLKRVANDTDENRKSTTSLAANLARLNVQLLTDFVTKRDFEPIRDRVDTLERDVTELQVVTGVKR